MAEARKPIKVLMMSHSSELSGAERSMLDLFAYWQSKGWVKPHFIIRRPLNNMAKELRERGWPYSALYYTNWSQRNPSPRAEDVYRNALFNTNAIFDIEKVIKEVKPDLVMTNTIVAPWAALASYFQHIPHIWFVREYGDVDHRHVFELGRDKMMQDINTLSSLVVTNSQTLAKHIADQIPKDKLQPLYTPFNLDKLEAKSQERATNPFRDKNSLKLVITGKIAPGKGQVEAVEAVAKLVAAGYETELCIIGKIVEPGDDQPLLEAIERHGLKSKVHMIGHQSNPLPFLKYADVGLMASKQEAFGRVTFEYMALKLPVVGTNSGATPEMVEDGQNGYLYEPGDTDGLVARLMNYAKDKDLITEHGLAARRKAESMMKGRYNADALYERLVTIVKEAPSLRQPLNFSHRWLEYPSIANQYIRDSEVISLKRLLYHRLRHRGKLIYLAVAKFTHLDPLGKVKG